MLDKHKLFFFAKNGVIVKAGSAGQYVVVLETHGPDSIPAQRQDVLVALDELRQIVDLMYNLVEDKNL